MVGTLYCNIDFVTSSPPPFAFRTKYTLSNYAVRSPEAPSLRLCGFSVRRPKDDFSAIWLRTQQNLIREGSAPSSNPLPFHIRTVFDRNGTPFIPLPWNSKMVPLSYTFYRKWYPFHIPSIENGTPFIYLPKKNGTPFIYLP